MTAVDDSRAASAGALGWERVRAAQAGDSDAFAALYRQYKPQVEAFTRHRVGGDNRDLVADLTSETFTRAWRRLDTVTEQHADPGAWLFTIARNLVTDHYKNAHTRRTKSVGSSYELEQEEHHAVSSMRPVSTEDVALDRLERSTATHTVRRVLNQLPVEHQVTLQAVLAEETEPAEAARIGVAPTAVKSRRYRARNAARRLLHTAGITSSTHIPAPRAVRDRGNGHEAGRRRDRRTVDVATRHEHAARTPTPEPTNERTPQMNEHAARATKIVDRACPGAFGEARSVRIRVVAEALGNNRRVDEIEMALTDDPAAQHKRALAITEATIKKQDLDLTPEQYNVLVSEVAAGLITRSIDRRAAAHDQARDVAERALGRGPEKQQENEAHGLGVTGIGA